MYPFAFARPVALLRLGRYVVTSWGLCSVRLVKLMAHGATMGGMADVPSYVYVQGQPNSLDKALQEEGVMMVLLYRDGCPYCRAFMPAFDELARRYRGRVSFGTIRFSDDPSVRSGEKEDMARLHGIALKTFPCLVIFKHGHKVEVIQGDERARELPRLEATLDRWLVEGVL